MKFQFTREELPALYEEALEQNDLLNRMLQDLTITGWSKEEILTAQLLAALSSNASLTSHARQLEDTLVKMAERKQFGGMK